MTLLKSQGAELKNGEVELAVIEIGVHSHGCLVLLKSILCKKKNLVTLNLWYMHEVLNVDKIKN
jgi:hypothetical protein